MTNYIPLASLVVAPNRQRRTFTPALINDLMDSIEVNGLLHAPVVRQEGDAFVLVAGERRLRAISDLHELGVVFYYAGEPVPAGQVPYTSLGELSPLEAWEAELEENIRRVDLSWQERAETTAALAELRQAQAREADAPTPTIYDLAKEVRDVPDATPKAAYGDAYTNTRNEIIVAKFLGDAEVAAAPTLKEAFKILKKREARQQDSDLAASVGLSFTTKSHRLLNEDSLTWMADQPPEQFSIVLSDPPYGMGADTFGDSGLGADASAHLYDDSPEEWERIMAILPGELFRLAKPQAHAYLFCDYDKFSRLRTLMSNAGWRVHRTPLIWHNPDGFRAPWPEHGCQRKYELILFAVKGDRKVRALKGDVLSYPKDKTYAFGPAKPVALLDDLLRRSAQPGDTVFDPFAGSGSTIEACHELKLTCTALEKDPATFGLAVRRLQALSSNDPGLF